MPPVVSALLASLVAWFRSRLAMQMERIVLCHQVAVYKQSVPSQEVGELIRDMWLANPTWGSPRIVGTLHKIGIDVAKSTVEKYRLRLRMPPSPTWKSFLNNGSVLELDVMVSSSNPNSCRLTNKPMTKSHYGEPHDETACRLYQP